MKTIKERAFDIIGEVMTMDDLYSRDEVIMMLERMAEEQKAIDIDKACEWLKWIMQNGSSYGEFPSEESIEDFRKVMEE